MRDRDTIPAPLWDPDADTGVHHAIPEFVGEPPPADHENFPPEIASMTKRLDAMQSTLSDLVEAWKCSQIAEEEAKQSRDRVNASLSVVVQSMQDIRVEFSHVAKRLAAVELEVHGLRSRVERIEEMVFTTDG